MHSLVACPGLGWCYGDTHLPLGSSVDIGSSSGRMDPACVSNKLIF